MGNLNFTVDSALLSELGEKLVETVHLALVELVKNSYDADATNVNIKFIENSSGVSEIHIIDDGIGMNFEQVERYWMRIATTNKLIENRSTNYGRPKTGSKGIGRFCCRRLGKSLKIVTIGKEKLKNKTYQPQFHKTEVIFNWEDFEPGTDVTDIKCLGEKTILNEWPTGTTLIIKGLVDEWNRQGYNYLKRQLAVLASNRGMKRDGCKEDPGFNIIIEAPKFEGGIRDIREDLINAGWGTINAHINKNNQAVCELNALEIGRKAITSKITFSNLKGVKLNLGVLVDIKGQMRDTSILSLGTLKQILPDWGGVQVKYKGFRVYPYGDDDWLEIDHDRGLRKQRPKDQQLFSFADSLKGVKPKKALLNMLSMRNYVGDVDIDQEAIGFEMKANREGFIKSPAVDELKQFVRFAIDWSTIYREYSIRIKAKKGAEAARQYLEETLKKQIEPNKVVESAVEYLHEEFKNIITLLPAKERLEFNKSFNTATTAIIRHDYSNREELKHLRLIASTSTLLLIFSHEVKSLLGFLENIRNSLALIENKLSNKDTETVHDIREELEESKIRFDELLSMTSLIGVDSKYAKPGNLALKDRIEKSEKAFRLILNSYDIKLDYSEVPNNIIISNILEAELYAILLNIISNSIKSVIAARGLKKIQISASREKKKNMIRIKDTGVGLNPNQFEEVFIPFIADPGGNLYSNLDQRLNPEDKYIVGTGSGLGLSIVKEIVQIRKGSINFCIPQKPWNAELEIILP